MAGQAQGPQARRSSLAPSLRTLAWTVLVLGLLLRTAPNVVDPGKAAVACDANAYRALAESLAAGKGFTFDNPKLPPHCPPAQGPSHHWGPLLPMVEAAFILPLGPTLLALNAALVTLSLLTVAAAYWTTRDLFGPDAGLLVGAAVAVEWTSLVFGSRLGYSENLVLLTFVLTLWAILRSLRDERFILLAGAFAGLGYLSKASMGWFFLIAGFGGLAWRVLHHGPRALRNRWYLGAIALFATLAGLWNLRNLLLFWDGTPGGLLVDWQTSAYNAHVFAEAFHQPDRLLLGLTRRLPVLAIGLFLPLAFLLKPIGQEVRARYREEAASGLVLAAAIVFLLGWLFASAYWVVENTRFWWADPIRYVAPALVPLLWLVCGRPGSAQRPLDWGFLYASSLAALAISRFFL
ncbi:MAG: ArnT family glycosyltransferase [Thermoplasmatota archaeon]